MEKKKISCFIIMAVMILQSLCLYPVMGQTIKITKFTQSPANPTPNQSILFRVRTEGDTEKVYMSIDGDKEINFKKKSNNVWEVERKLTIEGTRHIKVTAVDKDGDKDSVIDTIELKARENTRPPKETTTETTTERVYTGNIEKPSETTTEADENSEDLEGSDDFDGGEYSEENKIDEKYFELSKGEDMEAINKAAGESVFMFIGEPTFINKWVKEPIDPDNPNTSSYIKNGYTLVPLRAIAEAFGADVSWNQEEKTAVITLSGKKILITAGSDVMKVGDGAIKIEASAEVKDGRVFVPLRAIAESFNKNVYYRDRFIGITNNGTSLTDNGFELIRLTVDARFK